MNPLEGMESILKTLPKEVQDQVRSSVGGLGAGMLEGKDPVEVIDLAIAQLQQTRAAILAMKGQAK